jgi:uncharacterized protein DUF6602
VPNAIYRDRMINDIQYAVSEARNAARVGHPGLIGRIRELAADRILRPVLPAGFDIGTGKITDMHGTLSAESDLVIYNRALLPAVMYSNRDGIYPIESTYYAFEIKSECSACNLRDAIEKVRHVIALDHSKRDTYRGNKSPAVSVFFAFGSDLSPAGKTEFTRYKELDSNWKDDPVIRVICVVGRGYWVFSLPENHWLYQPATNTFGEVLILVSQTVNTLVRRPIVSERPAPLFGDYLRPPDKETAVGAT